jgi:hypothetical protein
LWYPPNTVMPTKFKRTRRTHVRRWEMLVTNCWSENLKGTDCVKDLGVNGGMAG